MFGAIIGNVIGSQFAEGITYSQKCDLFGKKSHTTACADMILMVCESLYRYDSDLSKTIEIISGKIREMQNPYGSLVAPICAIPCAYMTLPSDEMLAFIRQLSESICDQPEYIESAVAVAVAVESAMWSHGPIGSSVGDRDIFNQKITSILESYAISDDIRELLESFIQSAKFEKAIRRLIWRHDHVDAISAITGSIAGEYYNIPQHFSESTMKYLDESQIKIIQEFLHTYYPGPHRKYRITMEGFGDSEYRLTGRRYSMIREQLPLRFKFDLKKLGFMEEDI